VSKDNDADDASIHSYVPRVVFPFGSTPIMRYNDTHVKLLEDVRGVFRSGEGWLWLAEMLDRLHEGHPGVYDYLESTKAMGSSTSRLGLRAQQINAGPNNWRGLMKSEVDKAVAFFRDGSGEPGAVIPKRSGRPKTETARDRPRAHQSAKPRRVSSRRLTAIVPAVPTPEVVDLTRLEIGLRADGKPWHVNLTDGRHHLLAGSTGAGKSSVMHSIIRALAPAVHAGVVRLKGIDPKFGAELLPVRGLLDELMVFNGTNMDEVAEYMWKLIAEMQADLGGLVGDGHRRRPPTREHPFTLILIDEVAQLTSYLGTAKTREQINGAMGALLTMGRAAGWGVLAALQDPRKDVLRLRPQFTVKVAMRLEERVQVRMVLGEGARERGAECDMISKDLPGMAYVREDGDPDPVLVRAAYVSDADIAECARRFRAPGPSRVFGFPEGFPLPGEGDAA
jgi:hypothetical protein